MIRYEREGDMIKNVRWTIIRKKDIVYAGETGHVYGILQNIGTVVLRSVYLKATVDGALEITFKSRPDSGVPRRELFLGDLKPGQEARFYVEGKSFKWDTEGLKTFRVDAYERWPNCPTCGR